ncbi:unnamed protein product, partial [Tilletia caries]
MCTTQAEAALPGSLYHKNVHKHQQSLLHHPPVQSSYTDFKGTYETIEGLNTYVTGDASSKKAIVATQDIFGQAPQTKQAADIVAAATGARVYLPDYFHGKPVPQNAYPPD